MVPTRSSNDLKVAEFLMAGILIEWRIEELLKECENGRALISPSFLLMAEPMVDRAADVFCPA